MRVELDIIPIEEWLPGSARPFIISGPCSAETEEQVLNTARKLTEYNQIHALRAGIWKPRTRPNSFEGVGEIGLKWLKQAGIETGLPVITEVANAQHVEACLKENIDMLWVGARTTVNPFSVQEIADSLKGVDIPVFVKNPVNPDLQLWIGALERINRAGIKKLAAIHRGFSSYKNTTYRNEPNWAIPIDLKASCPQLDIFCDPSHIGGKRDLIHSISQKALDLDMSGLMIEAHENPLAALSDAEQQVDPLGLKEIITQLQVRNSVSNNAEFDNRLEELRNSIDKIDKELLEKLAERMGIVDLIGEYKHSNNVTILQIERWKEILASRSFQGNELGLSVDFIKELLRHIHKESITRQTKVMNNRLMKQV